MNKLDAALDWAQRGFRVFPLKPGAKTPLRSGWTEDATTDPFKIFDWWELTPEANIGVLTDDMIVVDIDMKNGKNGMKSYEALGLTLDTLMVQTPTGGYHAYFTGPNVSLSAGRLGDGLDIRSYHGYVVAPGSDISGAAYTLIKDSEVLSAPAALIALCTAARERAAVIVTQPLDDARDIQRATYYLVNTPPAIEGQGGDARTYEVICKVKDLGVSQHAALDLLLDNWNDRCDPPWAQEPLAEKIHNAYQYGTSAPGVNRIEAVVGSINVDSLPQEPKRANGKWFNHGDEWESDARWLYHNLLPATGVAALVAPQSSGKTFLVLELGRCTATGKPFFGIPVDDAGGVIIVFAGTEGSGVGPRMAALQEDAPIPMSVIHTGALGSKEALEQLALDINAKSKQMLEEFKVPVRLIVLETLSASGLIKDENDNTLAAEAMGVLGKMSELLNALVMFTHHPPKDGRGTRGAGAIGGSADYILEIEKDHGPIRRLELTKARATAQRSIGAFTLVPVVVGKDTRGRDITSLQVSMGQEVERVSRTPPGLDTFNTVLDVADAAPLTEGFDAVEIEELREGFKDKYTGSRDRSNIRKVFNRIVEWLEATGTLRLETIDGRRYIIRGEIL